ncbi:hypothetical protein CRE_27267 [Caenorhabditis remanei]|uniref:Uncharacterized protein n=1 Tax=Caenorhabditis remanei TaxID=31234 RepID=E3LPD3_CAERE|nr:hypothetical protein CRE_27267 [Caenorhabditis remanei]
MKSNVQFYFETNKQLQLEMRGSRLLSLLVQDNPNH